LQHQDGSSHVIAATVPNCRAYDPAFAGELAVIVAHGMREMLEQGVDVFYYITAMNENYAQPSLPAGVESDIVRGLYKYQDPDGESVVRLVGSGAILREAIEAARILKAQWNVDAEVWSATSYSELAREAEETQRWNRLHPDQDRRVSHIGKCLSGSKPVVAVSDYVRAYPSLIASYVKASFMALGTDGFGRSDTRSRLRSFFEVDHRHISLAALDALAEDGRLNRSLVAEAIAHFGIASECAPSWRS
jgi:pyruvate dehydrogenase E1 component